MASITIAGVDIEYIQFTSTEKAEYIGLRDMYYGTGGFNDGSYLVPFPRESRGGTDGNGNDLPDFFGMRKLNAHYENVFGPEIEAQVDPIFAKDQKRETKGNIVAETFVESPTKKMGETMSEYQRRKKINSKIFGAVFEILDSPITTPETGEGDLDKNNMEYVYFLTPSQIDGYLLDDDGSLKMLVYCEDVGAQNGDTTEADTLRVWINNSEFNTTFSKTATTFQYKNDEVINWSELDDFPVSLIEDNTRYRADRLAKSKHLGTLSIVKKIYNTTSQYNDSFIKNCFAFLAVNGRIPDDIDLGNDSIFMYVGESVNAPNFVAPPTDHLKIMIEEVARLIQVIKVNMNSTVAIASTASGEARMEADRRRIEKLKQDTQDIQDQEHWLVNTALTVYVEGSWTFSVVYPKDFESLTKADELASLQVLLDTGYLKGPVIDQVLADMIKITYPSDSKRGEELATLQIETVEETENDTFENPPVIEE